MLLGFRRDPVVRGFTLIELLVVVAIIGVLIGITIPILGSTRSRAREVACRSNLRQIGLMCMTYSNNDPKGFFPIEPTEHNSHPGLIEMAKAQGIDAKIFYCPEADVLQESASNTTFTPVGGTDLVTNTPDNVVAGNISYVYWSFLANKKSGGLSWRNPGFTPRKLRFPDNPMPVGTAVVPKASIAERWVVSDFFRQGAPFPHTRKHASGINVMYLDGHGDLLLGSPQASYR
ncbi:MAG: type II secretion system protein [Phycisphaerae bacterium]